MASLEQIDDNVYNYMPEKLNPTRLQEIYQL